MCLLELVTQHRNFLSQQSAEYCPESSIYTSNTYDIQRNRRHTHMTRGIDSSHALVKPKGLLRRTHTCTCPSVPFLLMAPDVKARPGSVAGSALSATWPPAGAGELVRMAARLQTALSSPFRPVSLAAALHAAAVGGDSPPLEAVHLPQLASGPLRTGPGDPTRAAELAPSADGPEPEAVPAAVLALRFFIIRPTNRRHVPAALAVSATVVLALDRASRSRCKMSANSSTSRQTTSQ